ncbi:4'-phosphopantetheinyl transferase superfamily protein [Candidatus Kaiserbacteria bacterium]|nr:MAG: 4'-phosphopantetheinyl transferase superfamily protein [Candidatus Kaiserbacteria bacterium]
MYTLVETLPVLPLHSASFAMYDVRDHEAYQKFLTENECTYLSRKNVEKYRDSLIGRVVAKFAVARCVKETFDVTLNLADIDIRSDGRQPVCTLGRNAQNVIPPHLSIAHSNGCAIALAVHAEKARGVGVDMEPVRLWKEETVRGFLVDQEYARCSENKESFSFYATLYWCLKEAYLKAIGIGLQMHPRDIEVHIDPSDEHNITLIIHDRIIPAQIAWTQKEGGYIITTIIL